MLRLLSDSERAEVKSDLDEDFAMLLGKEKHYSKFDVSQALDISLEELAFRLDKHWTVEDLIYVSNLDEACYKYDYTGMVLFRGKHYDGIDLLCSTFNVNMDFARGYANYGMPMQLIVEKAMQL